MALLQYVWTQRKMVKLFNSLEGGSRIPHSTIQCIVAPAFKLLPLPVHSFCSCDKVDHKQEVLLSFVFTKSDCHLTITTALS